MKCFFKNCVCVPIFKYLISSIFRNDLIFAFLQLLLNRKIFNFGTFWDMRQKKHTDILYSCMKQKLFYLKKKKHLEDVNINPTTIVLFCSAIQEVGI